MCQSGMVQALLEQGAELNDRQHPSMLTAVEYASEQDIRRLYAAGAKMELRNHLNSNVYDRAYYGKKQHIPLIHELGFDICEHAYHVGRIEFFKLIDTIEMKIGRTRLLRLSAQVDPYGDLYIVWHPASRRIGAYDVEHQEYHSLASWNDFIANPLVALEQVW
ncbi:hypothetical protein [Paenibacillus campi]|uniref:hypothetical protein n=1 Tax=Paenibacillus campi TaxID=3106031 RepID=UPI002AFF3BC7|nr:hypothetical protein [Paenibacillus sp. SGZ-1014]